MTVPPTLTELLQQCTKQWGEQPALRMRTGFRTIALRYAEVLHLSQKVARFLERENVQQGDRVLLLAPNSPYWVCAFFGCVLRGAVVVPLNIQSTPEVISKIAEQTGARLLFRHRHFPGTLPQHLRTFVIDFLPELLDESKNEKQTPKPESHPEPDSTAQLLYTSGTTGNPKGVILTHRNLCSNLEALASVFPLPQNARFLSILPLSHSFEQMAGFLLPFLAGAEIVYAHSPAAIGELLREHRITHLVAVPEFLQLLMRKIEAHFEERGTKNVFERLLKRAVALPMPLRRFLFFPLLRRLGGCLYTIASGGAPLDPSLEAKWEALGITILQGYGLTETSPVVSNNTYGAKKRGSVGKVLPGVTVKLRDDGEIFVRGPNVFSGYYGDKEKTKEAFINGWYRTGDIGTFGEGFLFIRGRKKYMILGPGGQNVYPEDIEEVLRKVRGLRDCCVLGFDREDRTDIHAVLLLDDNEKRKTKNGQAVAQRIIAEANSHLLSYQTITSFSLWDEDDFPRSATRKVQREKVCSALISAKGQEQGQVLPTATTPLTRLLSRITGTPAERISEKTNLARDLHLDSLLRIELVTRIEERFSVELEEAKITATTTVADIEGMMRAKVPVRRHPPRKWPRWKLAARLRVLLQSLIVFPLLRSFVRVRIEGTEYLRALALPAIFMPNHVSYLDSLVVLKALPLRVRLRLAIAAGRDMLYETYRRWSGFIELLFSSFPFPRKEGENIREGLEHMGRLLDQGCSIVVFPEGRISADGALLPLKGGAGLIATEMQALIVPMKITGTNHILPLGKLFPRTRGTVTIRFGTPLRFKRSDSPIEATHRLEQCLRALL